MWAFSLFSCPQHKTRKSYVFMHLHSKCWRKKEKSLKLAQLTSTAYLNAYGLFVDITIQHPKRMYASMCTHTFYYTKVTLDLKSMIFDVCLLSMRTKSINPEHCFFELFNYYSFQAVRDAYKSLSGYSPKHKWIWVAMNQ